MTQLEEKRLDTLVVIAHQIRMCTEAVDRGEATSEALFTAKDLARLFNLDRDVTKRLLKTLKELNIVTIVGFNPKQYRFDNYGFRQFMAQQDDDPLVEAFKERMNS